MANPNPGGLENISFSSTATYHIVQELGRGGMGIVYLAEKDNEGVIDHVVLKSIRTLSANHIERLKREANIATILRHENIVKTYGLEAIPLGALPPQFQHQLRALAPAYQQADLHTKQIKRQMPRLAPPKGSRAAANVKPITASREGEKMYCMAMDYVEGTDLGHLFRDHLRVELLVPAEFTAFIISRICRALSYAHQYIVHRDISPENIMVNTHGVAKLTDFGIAVASGEAQEFAGKVLYMAPEQIEGAEVDARADIYALGLVAYQVLTGITVFQPPPNVTFNQAIEHVRQRMRQSIPSPHDVINDVPKVLSAIVMKMLHPDRRQRYQHMVDVGNDLEQQYLYARGFGPTNNSLAAYMDIFFHDFKGFDQGMLKQLTFLKNRDGKIDLRRLFSWDCYTTTGKKLIKETQKGTLMYKVMQRQSADQATQKRPASQAMPNTMEWKAQQRGK